MAKKNVYMIQANYLYGKDAYLPYAIGVIAACAWKNERIKENFALKRILFLRENIEEAINGFEEPYLVAFSNYIWNFEYNKRFAQALKKKYPSCKIVFGGHNVRRDSSEQLKEYSFVDYLLHDEGEEPFRELLLALLDGNDLQGVPNLSYREKDGGIRKTPNKTFDSTSYPSPYLEGIFDDIVQEGKYAFTATLETNRGCPFKCAYCDWGACRTKLRQFPMEKIRKEIEWIARHKIDLCYCADANFGILERDNEIADILIEAKRKYGYPNKFRVCYTKNSNLTVFNINKKLNEYGMSKGATLSFQSVSPAVLKNIGRENLTMEKFAHLMTLYNGANIPTHSEIILGLPGETYDSFCDGIGKLLKNGQHTSINIFNCELLMNSRMGAESFIEKYGIETVETALRQEHNEAGNDDIPEKSIIVCKTNTMDTPMWIKSNMFSFAVQCFHCLGLLQYFAIYLHYEHHVDYGEFYKSFLDWVFENPSTIPGAYFKHIRERFDEITAGKGSWSHFNPVFGNILWSFEEGAFLEMVYHLGTFYQETEPFLRKYKINEDVFRTLLYYQQNMIKYPGKNIFDLELNYDFYTYFRNVYINDYRPLEKKNCVLHIHDKSLPDLWDEYARKVVWYGRKGGKNIHTDLTLEYL